MLKVLSIIGFFLFVFSKNIAIVVLKWRENIDNDDLKSDSEIQVKVSKFNLKLKGIGFLLVVIASSIGVVMWNFY
ncbi:hypothetical protein [Pontibacillus marinus]|uniref:DUF3899 domain-containing protein n=1 Tax=Pontibacillus marinus BH030004 = DSM 16465 TaxID=1385511 RepID=A0A0A5GBT7_9BACI|nr:hypothetical protein [Pontibacillus marinus]KGX89484.1 hypothetical protein N783_06120 [Pontibacillus marinus BH030004 = DSM 16465]